MVFLLFENNYQDLYALSFLHYRPPSSSLICSQHGPLFRPVTISQPESVNILFKMWTPNAHPPDGVCPGLSTAGQLHSLIRPLHS